MKCKYTERRAIIYQFIANLCTSQTKVDTSFGVMVHSNWCTPINGSTYHQREAEVARGPVELLVLVTSIDLHVLPFGHSHDVLAGQRLGLGVVARRSQDKQVLLPATLLALPDVKLSLTLGQYLVHKQFLGGRGIKASVKIAKMRHYVLFV